MNESKNILITGTSTGIGYDAAKSFLRRGFKVFGSVRNEADGQKLMSELGPNFRPLLFDVTDEQAVDAAAKQLEAEIGDEGLACLVNNAGIAIGGPILHIPIDKIRTQFEVNIIGLIKVTQAFSPLLGARKNHRTKPGKIINISSISGILAMPFIGPYTSSKHALEGLSHAMRRELQLYGIDAIIVGPGAVKTPIWKKSAGHEMEPYLQTDFEHALRKFQNVFVRRAVEGAFTSEWLGDRIVQIFLKKKPKARYSLLPNRFTGSFIPRLLPHRTLDRMVGKALGLRK